MTMRIRPQDVSTIESERQVEHKVQFVACAEQLNRWGVDVEATVAEVQRLTVAAPSWAVDTGGTRFGRFPAGGEPRNTIEKLDDIAALNALTGANRFVSLHVPWDDPHDPGELREYASELRLGFDAMNSNTFQDNNSTTAGGEISYKFGSLAHASPNVRKRAVENNVYCIDLGHQLGSTALTVWLADGTNHPGQADFRRQLERVADGLREIHDPPGRLADVHRAQAV